MISFPLTTATVAKCKTRAKEINVYQCAHMYMYMFVHTQTHSFTTVILHLGLSCIHDLAHFSKDGLYTPTFAGSLPTIKPFFFFFFLPKIHSPEKACETQIKST